MLKFCCILTWRLFLHCSRHGVSTKVTLLKILYDVCIAVFCVVIYCAHSMSVGIAGDLVFVSDRGSGFWNLYLWVCDFHWHTICLK